MNINISLLFFLASFLLTGCSYSSQSIKPKEPSALKMKEALVIGSAESPDPVLQRVQQLVRKGVVKDVVVFESFPVQIQLKASQAIINELNNMSRVKGELRLLK